MIPKTDIKEFGEIASLSASGKKVLGFQDLENARTITITCKATTHGDATKGVRVNVYYSPTGEREDWDTIPFAYFDIDLTAGSSTQESHNFDLPEKGTCRVEIENLDASENATFIQTWLCIKRWSN